MYIHIGGDRVLDENDIIALLPKQTVMSSYDTRRCIAETIDTGRVQEVYRGPGETYIITGGEKAEVFLSPVNSTTIAKRRL